MENDRQNLTGRIIDYSLKGPLPLIVGLFAIIAGVAALLITPREEEPQIVVPVADIMIEAPGLEAEQIERQVATPLEKLLTQIDGVEHVYSASWPDKAIITVRFHVGEDRVNSLVKIYNKIFSHTDIIPDAVASWVVKPVEIDDVPILVISLWSKNPQQINDHILYRLAQEVVEKLKAVPRTNRVEIAGGAAREIRIELDVEALAARRTSPLEVVDALKLSNIEINAGNILMNNENLVLRVGTFLEGGEALERLPVNIIDNVPVYLHEVAKIHDGPREPDSYSWLTFGPADEANNAKPGTEKSEYYPSVAISVAKQKGTNAVWVSNDIRQAIEQLKQELFPPGVDYRIIRDYGETANEKVNDLTSSLFLAIFIVIIFIGVFLGWRHAVVIALAIPICYGITFAINYFAGYTINRVTLFALILAIGLLVDDPITGLDNIERHFRLGKRNSRKSVILAITEIRSALIMSTIAIILAFGPLAFITGMMGPYMSPMALNVPVAVTVSTFVAFLVTPWLAWKILRREEVPAGYDISTTPLYRIYTFLIGPLIASHRNAWLFILFIIVLFCIAVSLPMLRLVPLKLLPFDNKNEFQVVIDMPEGTTLEETQSVTRSVAAYLRTIPEVREIAGFTGTASPMDFNGMIRRYYLRNQPHTADIRVTLARKKFREQQSHEIVNRLREDITEIGRQHQANIKIVEVPPGPPVVSTITLELYARPDIPYETLRQSALQAGKRFEREPFVVDIDTSVESDQRQLTFVTDKMKAALSGIATKDIAETLSLAINGTVAGYMQLPNEAAPLPIKLQLPVAQRNSLIELGAMYVKGRPGITKIRERSGVRDAPRPLVQLTELGKFEYGLVDKAIHHKNLNRVAYVYADAVGRPPADAIIDMNADLRDRPVASNNIRPISERSFLLPGGGDYWELPEGIKAVWNGEGEWQITLRVFRDMGIAFAVALVGIFFVLYLQTGSAIITLIIMTAIPLTVIGIMPGFWLLNNIGERMINDIPNPLFFTATAMIGMIALAGIVVRNSLILVEFINSSRQEGFDLRESILRAGAVRMRPIFLTAGTTMLGNIVITLDPIFSGLAWAVIFGMLASTLFTLGIIPVVYYLVYQQQGKAT